MTLRPEYALGHSALNAFLFAPAGKDEAGQDLTVLSVLARLGLDPWAEAARLASLPRDAAAQALAALLGQGDRKTPDMDNIAARLVDCLPRDGVQPIPASPAGKAAKATSWPSTLRSMRPSIWLICLAAAVGWFFFVSYLQSDPVFEPASSIVTPK